MDSHLQEQALMLTLRTEIAHRLAHADGGRNGAVRGLEGRHHGVPDGLHDGTPFGRNDLLEQPEMLVDEIEGDEVADMLVELGRALEVREQEGQAEDLEALADRERVSAVEIAKRLVGEEAPCREDRLASRQE